MALIAYLRSRYGLYHIHLEPEVVSDIEVDERLQEVIQQTGAVPVGSSWLPVFGVEYYTVGREGFRIGIPEYPGIEGIDVWGSKKIIGEILRIWKGYTP
jgi:hypothetical protein